MPFVDVHCHLDYPELYSKLDNVVENAKKAGVVSIITNGVDPESNRKVIELAKKYDIVKAAVGIYPPDALKVELGEKFKAFDIDKELEWISKQKNLTAIGEIGLDLKNGSNLPMQKKIFSSQLDLAKKMKKTALIHTRKAEQESFDLVESSSLKKVVFHCFGGKLKLAKKIADADYYFSIVPNIVKSQHVQKLVELVSMDQLLTETDSPFQGMEQGIVNEPKNVVHTVKKIAEIKGLEKKEVENIIYMNYQRLFC